MEKTRDSFNREIKKLNWLIDHPSFAKRPRSLMEARLMELTRRREALIK